MKKTYADQCLERADKATKGYWYSYEAPNENPRILSPSQALPIAEVFISPNDAYLIAHARTDVPELARRLKEACEALKRADDYIVNETEGRCQESYRMIAYNLEAPLGG